MIGAVADFNLASHNQYGLAIRLPAGKEHASLINFLQGHAGCDVTISGVEGFTISCEPAGHAPQPTDGP